MKHVLPLSKLKSESLELSNDRLEKDISLHLSLQILFRDVCVQESWDAYRIFCIFLFLDDKTKKNNLIDNSLWIFCRNKGRYSESRPLPILLTWITQFSDFLVTLKNSFSSGISSYDPWPLALHSAFFSSCFFKASVLFLRKA